MNFFTFNPSTIAQCRVVGAAWGLLLAVFADLVRPPLILQMWVTWDIWTGEKLTYTTALSRIYWLCIGKCACISYYSYNQPFHRVMGGMYIFISVVLLQRPCKHSSVCPKAFHWKNPAFDTYVHSSLVWAIPEKLWSLFYHRITSTKQGCALFM